MEDLLKLLKRLTHERNKRGNKNLKIIPYTDINEIINNLENILKEEN